ncbi:MAG: deoxyribose-phosphate aldolase [Paludibacteraceae bacterium]|nr:deoxyribose-phosphate aldolase [Paludibacteraceae bacterium]
MSKIEEALKSYNLKSKDEDVKEAVKKIQEKVNANATKEVYKTCFSCIDLTALNHTDTEASIEKIIEKVNAFKAKYADIPNVAAVCVYPSMVATVKETLKENIGIASVAGGFPSSQTFIEIKIAETGMCVYEGANEIDIVISIGKYLSKDYETLAEEIMEIKDACRDAHLKVILETGTLKAAEDIYRASLIAMEAGADFIKTSTGKTEPAATPEAAYTMCLAIKDFYNKRQKKVGFKAAGGIVSVEDAVLYYSIVKEVLGKEWLTNDLFRIGASRLANNLLSAIKEKEEKYF